MRVFIVFTIVFLTACVTTLNAPTVDSNQRLKADARIALGMRYLQQKNTVKAKKNLQMALEHAPKYYRSQLAMAHYLETVLEFEQAQKMYENAQRSEPNNGKTLNDYGSFLCKRSRYQLAQKQFAKAVTQPDYYRIADSYENAALCWLKEGKPSQAIVNLRLAMAHDPNRPQTLLNLAQLEIERGHFDAALAHINQFEHRFGQHPLSLTLLADIEKKKLPLKTQPK
ncbi:type IV pilus biogenesis/stability protein PilW [Vibrio pectenicida]|uniref:Type IV pilus biogenesis/stability protein PilW n=1 Tax=Vibrio pectenicida TaxID=62763 RepID=A0A3R9FJL3_9VIBR|nr:type IV pilus biogenesis/stability protein PilW [Vibrio pectenicida]RSD29503.1 type IV pilus biogenesis/stability protein PilW [Vibrio pectenicida]